MSGSSSSPRRSLGPRLAVLWFLLTTALLVWPIFPWLGNHVHPRVLGLPWSLVWVLGVIALNFGALLLLYRLRVIDDREHDEVAEAADVPPPGEPP
ncbi:hypothetical protein [Paraliomyxa miuraensis]|uniref:hypothetical protein n=1 Tax=Paraliomyxa miuraensis TaxID=376150 RepID=UPI00225639D1|nr:hypothetical protein [Paraliomyxa miuraensis]MCX4245372.1 hypothetical protein [Paraliomyxa miuraensis]